MTCIVAYKQNKKIYMGGDSAGVAGYNLYIRADEKVFQKGNMIFGFTSSFRMGQIIRYSLKIPDHDPRIDDYEYLCTVFIDSLRKCYKNKGYKSTKDGVESGGIFLLGYRENIYKIESDFQVGKTVDPFIACGCGEDFALGAMEILEHINTSNEDKILNALKTAEKFSAGVRGPFNIISI